MIVAWSARRFRTIRSTTRLLREDALYGTAIPRDVSAQNPEEARWFLEEVQPHEPALRAYLRGRFPTLQDIDDLVQDAYARVIHARHTGRVGHPKAYLFATARNAALDLFRRGKIISIEGIAEIERLSVLEDRPDAAEQASHDQELEILTAALDALPERCRQIFTMRRLQDMPHREIAQALGISEHTVNAQLAIGILRCRAYLRARGVLKGSPHEIA
jgi:RNA polymerase sigma factor (sigma-70 family)